MNTHQKFLEFNGKNLIFLSIEGTYWIALKPILDALSMDADRSIKTLKNDPILGAERSLQTVQVSKNGTFQGRNMTCLPEKYIYGWLFSLRSESPELIEFKRTCYELLYNHFHGTITNRKELLMERNNIAERIATIKNNLKEQNETFKELEKLDKQRKKINTELQSFDKELVKQPELFGNPSQ